MKTVVDHLMWGVADLDEGIAEAGRLLGVTPVPGGVHTGLGTRNALVGLADGKYLEIIAPDPAQRLAGTFGAVLADLSHPALLTWALASRDLPGIAAGLAAAGVETRGPVRTRRTTPAGELLEWDLLFSRSHVFGALLPFFIDWLDCRHPAETLVSGGSLEALAIATPHAGQLRALLGEIDVPLVIVESDEPTLHATIETVHGPVVLESAPATVGLRFG